MTAPDPTTKARTKFGLARRIGGATLIAALVFGLLWYTIFNAVTAALVASGGTVVLVAGASTSDTLETIFETIANILLAIVGAIADFFTSIFD